MMNFLKRFKLNRPFSRKIGLSTDQILTEAGRNSFFNEFNSIVGRSPLATALGAVAHAYDGKFEEATRLTASISGNKFSNNFHRLYDQADLRKFFMECMRDHYAKDHKLPQGVAKALLQLANATDPQSTRIYRESSTGENQRSPIKFDYVHRRPGKLKILLLSKKLLFSPQFTSPRYWATPSERL